MQLPNCLKEMLPLKSVAKTFLALGTICIILMERLKCQGLPIIVLCVLLQWTPLIKTLTILQIVCTHSVSNADLSYINNKMLQEIHRCYNVLCVLTVRNNDMKLQKTWGNNYQTLLKEWLLNVTMTIVKTITNTKCLIKHIRYKEKMILIMKFIPFAKNAFSTMMRRMRLLWLKAKSLI